MPDLPVRRNERGVRWDRAHQRLVRGLRYAGSGVRVHGLFWLGWIAIGRRHPQLSHRPVKTALMVEVLALIPLHGNLRRFARGIREKEAPL